MSILFIYSHHQTAIQTSTNILQSTTISIINNIPSKNNFHPTTNSPKTFLTNQKPKQSCLSPFPRPHPSPPPPSSLPKPALKHTSAQESVAVETSTKRTLSLPPQHRSLSPLAHLVLSSLASAELVTLIHSKIGLPSLLPSLYPERLLNYSTHQLHGTLGLEDEEIEPAWMVRDQLQGAVPIALIQVRVSGVRAMLIR